MADRLSPWGCVDTAPGRLQTGPDILLLTVPVYSVPWVYLLLWPSIKSPCVSHDAMCPCSLYDITIGSMRPARLGVSLACESVHTVYMPTHESCACISCVSCDPGSHFLGCPCPVAWLVPAQCFSPCAAVPILWVTKGEWTLQIKDDQEILVLPHE